MHQIKNAQQAGYEESEIVSVVIGAMIPSLTLRNILETISNLSLAQLQKYLQSHYGEQNATDLANNLTSMVQFPSESSYAFVMRCIEMRQKLIMSSDKADIKYDRALIQKLFLRTLERGILRQVVVQEVKHLLRQDSLCDEELLSAITKAACYKRERDVLLSKSKNPKQHQHVSEASVCSSDPKHNKASGNDSSNGNSRIGDSSSNPVLKLTSIVESLALQLSSLQNDIVT